jgi:acyl-CoA dehydrogenase
MSDLIAAWHQAYPDPLQTRFAGMAEAGFFRIGLEDSSGYAAIARMWEKLVARTGLLGLGSAWAARQMAARFFVRGFSRAEQQEELLPLLSSGATALAVAISEPGVGAHPKHLSTRAEADGDGVRINGEKAWVSNGPDAGLFLVFAITAEQAGRKRFSAFLVPRETPGLELRAMPEFHGLCPARHCGLVLRDCRVPHTAQLGPEGDAFAAMAVPFRDVEDAVGAAGLVGAFRFALARLAADALPDALASLGAIAALTDVLAHGAAAAVAALDAGALAREAGTVIGLRLLAAEIARRIHGHRQTHPAATGDSLDALLADAEIILNVAKGPRLIRQTRLGAALRHSPP